MSSPARLHSLEEALEQMLHGVEPLAAEEVALEQAAGRVLAKPLSSRLTLPPWDNSAMDGFALRAADVAGASNERPVSLPVVGEAAAGHAAEVSVGPGSAVRILTGAPLPAGADAVVPLEDTRPIEGTDSVAILRPPTPGAHIRRAASDLRPGYPLLAAGEPLSAAALAAAAAGGHGRLSVYGRPKVAVLSTGDELVAPGEPLGPAQIPDSNSIGLLAQAGDAGAEVRLLGIARDELADVLVHLQPALGWADVIVVSGGVSVGAHDVVKEAFEAVGRLELWRVAVQPGKPLAFARASGAADAAGPVLFGLPGNPVSSFVTFELFVRPLLRRLGGWHSLSGREVVRARLTEELSKSAGRRAFLRVRLAFDPESGEWQASLAGGQSSHVLSALVAADGLAIVPEDRESMSAGEMVEVMRLDVLSQKGGSR